MEGRLGGDEEADQTVGCPASKVEGFLERVDCWKSVTADEEEKTSRKSGTTSAVSLVKAHAIIIVLSQVLFIHRISVREMLLLPQGFHMCSSQYHHHSTKYAGSFAVQMVITITEDEVAGPPILTIYPSSA